MKYLTAPYLTLMHAFKDRAFERLDSPDYAYLHPISRLQEYGTLRIDGGRQTGKTEAASQFAAEWLANGDSVVVIANQSSYSRETADRIERRWESLENYDKEKGVLINDTVRSFLGGSHNKFRGISLKRTLFIIEEPIRIPEMYKFYKAWEDLHINYISFKPPLPLFFVMGIQ